MDGVRSNRWLPRGWVTVAAALLVVPVLVVEPAEARSPAARSIDAACPSALPAAGFEDVDRTATHGFAVDCVVMWKVAQGVTSDQYAPSRSVTRGQMATFLARMITESGGSLPGSPPDAFTDDQGDTHERAINQLAAAGVVQGRSGRSYDPAGRVTRAQMATFLARTYEYRTGRALPDGSGFFSDTGGVHERNIDRVAAAGITGGASAGKYEPDRPVTRAQMASFMARLLDLLVEEGVATLPASPTVYLAELPLVSQSKNLPYRTRFEAASVNGDSYLRSVVYEIRGSESMRWREWNLGRDYVRLRATVGLRDDTHSDRTGVMRVYLDGVEVVEVPMELGRSVPLDLDVSGALRLRLEVQTTTYGQSFWVWGNARVNAW